MTASVGMRPGPQTQRITVTTNDRASQTVTLEGEINVLSAVRAQPENVNFQQVKRDAPAQKQTVTITRGNGGPLQPKVVSTGNPQITTELREVEAGEKYELDVTIAPPWPNGMMRGTVQIDTGVEQAPQENIQVFANILPRLQAAPQRFMVQPEPKSDLDLSVHLNWDGTPGKILEATTSDPATTVRVNEEDGKQIVVLHVPAGYNPQNRLSQSVTLKTDDPVVPTMQIPVFIANLPGGPAGAQGTAVTSPKAVQGPVRMPTAATATRPAVKPPAAKP